MTVQMQNEEGQWVPAIPEPLWVRHWFRWKASCCGVRFSDRDAYDRHYLDTHVESPVLHPADTKRHGRCTYTGVSRDESCTEPPVLHVWLDDWSTLTTCARHATKALRAALMVGPLAGVHVPGEHCGKSVDLVLRDGTCAPASATDQPLRDDP